MGAGGGETRRDRAENSRCRSHLPASRVHPISLAWPPRGTLRDSLATIIRIAYGITSLPREIARVRFILIRDTGLSRRTHAPSCSLDRTAVLETRLPPRSLLAPDPYFVANGRARTAKGASRIRLTCTIRHSNEIRPEGDALAVERAVVETSSFPPTELRARNESPADCSCARQDQPSVKKSKYTKGLPLCRESCGIAT